MIERLYAHNFRCLENFTLDLADRPSALLIGKNGSGKSTVLNCFRLFQRIGRGSSRVQGPDFSERLRATSYGPPDAIRGGAEPRRPTVRLRDRL